MTQGTGNKYDLNGEGRKRDVKLLNKRLPGSVFTAELKV